MHDIILIYSPFPSMDTARTAAQALLSDSLVACCNILPLGESHYVWQGSMVVAPEVLLIAKTGPERLAAARQRILSLHPYETPAILSFSAESTEPFALWVMASLGSPTAPPIG